MPKIFFNGDESDEQSVGPTLNSGVMQLFAMRRTSPLNMISLGGHRIDDAPEYNNTEAIMNMSYRHLNGLNVVEETQLNPEVVKSLNLPLALPNRLVSVTDRIYQEERRSRLFDYVLVPDTCDDNCDEFFWFGNDGRLGIKTITSSILGYDENATPINTTRSLRVTGNLREYHGMVPKTLLDHDGALYAVAINEDRCAESACPYQELAVGGADTDILYTTDGGTNWSTVDTTAISTDVVSAIITDLAYFNGLLVIAYSDVADGTGTDGGLAYSASYAAAVLGQAADGIQKLVNAGNRLYAFGTAGEAFYTENGIDWTDVSLTGVTEDVLDADYDKASNTIFLAVSNGEVYAFDPVLNAATDITSDVGVTVATDVTSVTVEGPRQVAFGGADGNVYENFAYGDGGSWSTTANLGGSIAALASAGNAYRVIAGVADDIQRRDLFTRQAWQVETTVAGNITAIVRGLPLPNEGVNYFVAVDAGNRVTAFTACDLCIE